MRGLVHCCQLSQDFFGASDHLSLLVFLNPSVIKLLAPQHLQRAFLRYIPTSIERRARSAQPIDAIYPAAPCLFAEMVRGSFRQILLRYFSSVTVELASRAKGPNVLKKYFVARFFFCSTISYCLQYNIFTDLFSTTSSSRFAIV